MEKKQQNEEPGIEAENRKQSGKYTFYLIAGILILFSLIFIFYTVKNLQGQPTIDELHKRNLEGKEGPDNYLYNGYSFVRFEGLWYTQVQYGDTIYDVTLRHGPREVEDIPIDVNLALIDPERFPERYSTIDPDLTDAAHQSLAVSELTLNLVTVLGIKPYAACTKPNEEVCGDRDIINCSYENAPIIYIKEDDTPMVYDLNTCYVIQGKGMDVLKSANRFLYKIYGIME